GLGGGDVVEPAAADLGGVEHQVGRARHAAQRAGADALPIQSHRAHEGGAGDLIADDVVDFQAAGLGVAQDHVAGAAARKVAEAADLPIEADGSHEIGAGDLIVGDVVDLDPTGVDVAQHHVGFAEAAEIAEAHDLPVHPDI